MGVWTIDRRGVAVALRLTAVVTAVILGVGLAVSAREAAGPAAQDGGVTKTVRDRVYSDAQARRGKAAYDTSCVTCHRDDLSGSDMVPPLVGDTFLVRWDNRTLGDLFDLMRTSMPSDAPASLSGQVYVDLVAYVLQANDFPAGTEELKNDPGQLKNITIK